MNYYLIFSILHVTLKKKQKTNKQTNKRNKKTRNKQTKQKNKKQTNKQTNKKQLKIYKCNLEH